MSRFAPIAPSKVKNVKPDSSSYKFGFHSSTDKYAFKSGKGLSLKVVEDISSRKNEPEWMRKERLTGLKIFEKKEMPLWGADLSTINFDDIYYYLKPTNKEGKNWEDVPLEIKKTFDKLGIP
ncbi:MAG: Fe-S cluster assembly protein SufB, partial [Patescibacteria group bacterium]